MSNIDPTEADIDGNPYTPAMRAAFAAWMALTDEERGLVACWFCHGCHRFVGLDDRCNCMRDE